MTLIDPPNRPRDRWTALVAEWQAGWLLCESPETERSLPGSDGQVHLPLCDRHVRWAMASRRERLGKQAGRLKKLLVAWSHLYEDADHAARARIWLGY